jgi:O-antigen ligase
VSLQTKSFLSSDPVLTFLLYGGAVLLSVYAVAVLPWHYSLLTLVLLALLTLVTQTQLVWTLLYLSIAATLIAPALYPSALGGEIPVYPSSLLLLAFFLMIWWRSELYDWTYDSIGSAGALLLLTMALSLPFAYWLSGFQVGSQSSLRLVLILQPWLLYFWIYNTKLIANEEQFSRFVRWLLMAGSVAAIYGIVDFYFPFQFSHPFADQYIYLQDAMIRRAQGPFYEASSFGNLCAFLLTLSLLHLYYARRGTGLVRLALLVVLVGIFGTGLFLAYSRGSWLNVAVTVTVFLILQNAPRFRRTAGLVAVLVAVVYLLYQVSPAVVANFFEWRLANLLEFWSDPSFATSGRWETWARLFAFFGDQPWLLFFGIGYKSLASTVLFGSNLIADNGFLSALFETGIIGLIAFLNLNWVIFKSLYKTSQHQNSTVRRYAAFLLAFWCGEMAQMVTGDLFTYWRNLTIYLALMAFVQRISRPEPVIQAV